MVLYLGFVLQVLIDLLSDDSGAIYSVNQKECVKRTGKAVELGFHSAIVQIVNKLFALGRLSRSVYTFQKDKSAAANHFLKLQKIGRKVGIPKVIKG